MNFSLRRRSSLAFPYPILEWRNYKRMSSRPKYQLKHLPLLHANNNLDDKEKEGEMTRCCFVHFPPFSSSSFKPPQSDLHIQIKLQQRRSKRPDFEKKGNSRELVSIFGFFVCYSAVSNKKVFFRRFFLFVESLKGFPTPPV